MPHIYFPFIFVPDDRKTLPIVTKSGTTLTLTRRRTRSIPGRGAFGRYGGLVHAMRLGGNEHRRFPIQLCVPIGAAERDFGESSAGYLTEPAPDDDVPTCKKCLTILATARPA